MPIRGQRGSSTRMEGKVDGSAGRSFSPAGYWFLLKKEARMSVKLAVASYRRPPTSSETSGGCWLNTNTRRDHETKWVLSRQPQMEIRVELREGEPERHIGLGNLWEAITDQRAGERLPIDAPLTPRL